VLSGGVVVASTTGSVSTVSCVTDDEVLGVLVAFVFINVLVGGVLVAVVVVVVAGVLVASVVVEEVVTCGASTNTVRTASAELPAESSARYLISYIVVVEVSR